MTLTLRFSWPASALLALLAGLLTVPLEVATADLRARVRLQQAENLQNQFLFDEALGQQRAAARISPQDAKLQLDLANSIRTLWFFRRDPVLRREADVAYAQASTLSPHWSLPFYEHARVYSSRQQYAQGLALLSEAIRLDPNNPGYWLERGRYLEGLKRPAEAGKAYQRCSALLPPGYEPECDRGAQRLGSQP